MLTPQDVAERCSLSVRSVYRFIRTGDIAAHRLGRSYRVAPSDLQAWLAAGRVEADVSVRCFAEGDDSFRWGTVGRGST